MAKKKDELGRVRLIRKRLSELRAAKYNPRTMSKKAAGGLDRSIEKYGLAEPIVWNRRTKNVVGGHQRLESLKRQGVKVTDVRVVDLPLIEEKGLNLALNSRSLQGDWTPAVAEILEEIRLGAPELVEPLLLDDIEIPPAEPDGEPAVDKGPPTRFSIIIECQSEKHQGELLSRLEKEGLKARGMKA